MTTDLMKSILAMDVYNRGYNFGIDLDDGIASEATTNSIGSFNIPTNSALAFGPNGAQSIGFYAIACEVGNEIVISYRGTDNLAVDQAA